MPCPAARSCAVWSSMRIALLTTMPTIITSAISDMMLMVAPVKNSASAMPTRPSGRVTITVSGWMKLSSMAAITM